MHPSSKSRIIGVATATLCSLVAALADGHAEAAVATCDPITAVSFQQTTGSPGEALVIYCPNAFYMAFIGSPTPACNIDIGTEQGMQAAAVSARVAGKPLTINYNDTTCGSGTLHIISSVTF